MKDGTICRYVQTNINKSSILPPSAVPKNQAPKKFQNSNIQTASRCLFEDSFVAAALRAARTRPIGMWLQIRGRELQIPNKFQKLKSQTALARQRVLGFVDLCLFGAWDLELGPFPIGA